LRAALPAGRLTEGEGGDARPRRLRRLRRQLLRARRAPAALLRAHRAGHASGLHRHYPPLALLRPRPPRSPHRLDPPGPRRPPLRRRRLRLPDLRLHADHAGPGPHPRRPRHLPRRPGPDHRHVLTALHRPIGPRPTRPARSAPPRKPTAAGRPSHRLPPAPEQPADPSTHLPDARGTRARPSAPLPTTHPRGRGEHPRRRGAAGAEGFRRAGKRCPDTVFGSLRARTPLAPPVRSPEGPAALRGPYL